MNRRTLFDAIRAIFPNVLLWSWLALAVILCAATKDQPNLRIVAAILLALVWLVSSEVVARALLRPLENDYPQQNPADLRAQGVRQVLVLSGGGRLDQIDKGAVESLTDWSRARYLAGADLAIRLGPNCRLLFTGSVGDGYAAATKVLFPERTFVAESRSKETAFHPAEVRDEIGTQPFAMVTSAFHMPRSMRVFRRNGLEPIAYPVGYMTRSRFRLFHLIPTAEGLALTQLALTEYVAYMYDRLLKP